MRTFGCQMNVRDAELISGLLQKAGYQISSSDQDADIIIFNTCSVRKHAEDRVWSLIGSYKGSKIIGLMGCMAQNYKEQAFQRDANVNFVVGPQDIDKLPGIIKKVLPGKYARKGNPFLFERKIWETDGKIRPEEIYHTKFHQDKDHKYVIISEGCSNFCSYCVVPYVRGPLRHRKIENILKEIREAIEDGITKITLLGQNVNAYRDRKISFANLLEQVNAFKGLKQIDFFTSHPKDAKTDLFKAIRDLDKLALRLHLPLQSGSDRILKLMQRGYTVKDYLALIDSYRKIVKGGRLTTDIIVGFPTETDSEFKQTCALIKQARFNAAYIFKYSLRPGTAAAKIIDQLSPAQLEKRHNQILDLQRGISKDLRSRQA
jgi:tRNA-2-methylthio-N6-dimethylallyladenosine synthase